MTFFCQAEDGIRDLVRSRGLGDVYKRQSSPAYPIDLKEAVMKDIVRQVVNVLATIGVIVVLSLIHI